MTHHIAPFGEKILVHTSNFRKVKRTEDVVKIFAQVIKSIPSKLLMVGDGPDRVEYPLLEVFKITRFPDVLFVKVKLVDIVV